MAEPPSDADGVFEGGGVRGIAFAGALAAAEEAGVRRWVNVAGTSAGAIVAALLAVGYSAAELRGALLDGPLSRFADYGPGGRVLGGALNALRSRGLVRGRAFPEWLAGRFAAKLGRPDATFADVQRDDLPPGLSADERERARFGLRVIASDVTSGEMLVLPGDIERYVHRDGRPRAAEELTLLEAVRMSMSYPYLFEPVTLYRRWPRERRPRPCYVVDGGLLSNFPVWLFDSPAPVRHTWGFRLHRGSGPEQLPHRDLPRPFWELPLARAMLEAAMEAWDRRTLLHTPAVRTVSIPTGDIGTTQFDLSREQVEDLYDAGHREAARFFADRPAYVNSLGAAPEART